MGYFALRTGIQERMNYAENCKESKSEIQSITMKLNPLILSIPGIGENFAVVTLAEIGGFSNFSFPDKILV